MDKTYLTLLLIGLCIVSSGCVSSSTDTESPDKVVEKYVDSLFGFSMEAESAYNTLSDNVKSNITLTDFKTEMSNIKGYSVPSYKLEKVNVVSQTNTTANVSAIIRANVGRGTYTETLYFPLIRAEESWKIDKKLNPFV